MTREDAINWLDRLYMGANITDEYGDMVDMQPYEEAFNMAIKALEQDLCEDCISREWLKTAIHNFFYGLKHIPTEEDIQAYIEVAPPVTPKEKTGKWILLDECANSGYYCSECRKKVVKEGWSNTVKKIKYCPNCGKKIVEPPESEVQDEDSN